MLAGRAREALGRRAMSGGSAAAAAAPPARTRYKYWVPMQTQWHHNDQYGHVNNSTSGATARGRAATDRWPCRSCFSPLSLPLTTHSVVRYAPARVTSSTSGN
jgi:hypothetical protein